jgi:hypothetical protein
MPIDPEKFKQDRRTPAELAKAILDHDFTPRLDHYYGMTFREHLLFDGNSPSEVQHGTGLLWTLKTLEADVPLIQEHKDGLRHALEVMAAYRRESANYRDSGLNKGAIAQAKRDTSPNWEYIERLRREDADWRETCMVEISNLNAIEKMIRALAQRLNVPLIDPRRR